MEEQKYNDAQQQLFESHFHLGQQQKLAQNQLQIAVSTWDDYVKVSIIPLEQFQNIQSSQLQDKRNTCDIVCVLDISGSMNAEAQVKNQEGIKESFGLSYLDVLKHAVKTTIMNDRFALISFSDTARVEYSLSLMTEDNKNLAIMAIDNLQTEGSTNICGGLQEALDELQRQPNDGSRHQSIILLTDGEPNIFPPSGHIPFLQKYFSKNPEFRPNINTFALGKFMDSQLLDEIAIEGKGQYCFIPCPGFMGTIFVNALSNFLSTYISKTEICIDPLNGAQVVEVLGGVEHQFGQNGKVLLQCGDVKFGQSRDFVLRMKYPNDINMPFLTVNLKYHDYQQKSIKYMQLSNQIKSDNQNQNPLVLAQKSRLQFVTSVKEAVATMKKGNWDQAKQLITDLAKDFNNQISFLKSNQKQFPNLQQYYQESIQFLESITKDVEGEVRLAFLKEEWFKQWGRHFLPSLCHAHLKQQCNNFADPGIQGYGGIIFKQLKDEAEETFLKLPPPKPSRKEIDKPQYQQKKNFGIQKQNQPEQKPRSPSPIDMQKYYDGGGGCFYANGVVQLQNGSFKQIKDVRKGDTVKGANGKWSKIECVIKIFKGNKPFQMIQLDNGLVLTRKHPIFYNGKWCKPFEVGRNTIISPNIVQLIYKSLLIQHNRYNFVLKPNFNNQIIVNDILCSTFGHQIKESIAFHPYFGTDKIINDLKSFSSYKFGDVIMSNDIFERNSKGSVCYLKRNNLFDNSQLDALQKEMQSNE